MDNQVVRVRKYIAKHGSITTWQAIYELGITRLSAKIYDLKANGYDVDDEWIEVENRYGQLCRVKRYRIAPEQLKIDIDELTGGE